MSEFYLTLMGRKFYEAHVPAFINQLDRLNNNLEKIVAGVERTHKDNDQWLAGRVTMDASTHVILLEAVQRLSGHFDKWFELQTKPRVMVQDGWSEEKPSYWSNEDGWVDLNMATLFSDHEKNELNLPIGGAWMKSSQGGWIITQVDRAAAVEGEQQSLDGPDPVYLRELAEKVMNIPIMHGVDQSDAEHLDRIARRLEKK